MVCIHDNRCILTLSNIFNYCIVIQNEMYCDQGVLKPVDASLRVTNFFVLLFHFLIKMI